MKELKNPKRDQFFENQIDSTELLCKKKLADKLGISVRYVEKLMRAEGLPYFKIGRSVRFHWLEINEWLLLRRMP